ncbi:hypothetical protein GDO86_010694 [Hymenochirus boettgeri]|uniref:glucuronosyltransferase n=1 Tax=Hymenochirus boettgeri TaxID=247094 RepID=A0A8T2JD90_9PIPI|nr:hypothetical protein GDO86_010694 [Hymenochirus boettgeri]
MSAERKIFVLCLLVQQFLLLRGAKILTVSFVGGSHYMLMDKISRILQSNGHEVKMFSHFVDLSSDVKNQDVPYSHIVGKTEEKYVQETLRSFRGNITEFFSGRDSLHFNFAIVDQMSHQCKMIFNQSSIINSLKVEAFDIAVIDASNPCTFLLMEKIGKPFIAFFPTYSVNAGQVGIPSPLSYVPFLGTRLTDQMDFFQRVKNVLVYLLFHMAVNEKISSMFNDVIEENFPEGSKPSLSELYKKAELWIYNSDFAIDFPHPLLPHVIYAGGLLSEAPMHVSPELEDFISESGQAGFIIVCFGSMIPSYPVIEMNEGLAKLSQKVIWRYKQSDWPKEVKLAPNVKLMDWIPQNDLLGENLHFIYYYVI